jgi:hypothetical protein
VFTVQPIEPLILAPLAPLKTAHLIGISDVEKHGLIPQELDLVNRLLRAWLLEASGL